MLTGIVAGFGEVIGQARLDALWAHGFRLIRQDVQTLCLQAVFNEGRGWEQRGGQMLYITSATTLPLVPDGSWIEYLNEPEYLTPYAYAYQVRQILPEVQRRNLTLWAGSIGNTDKDSLAWLKTLLDALPELDRVAVHRYAPDAAQSPERAHRGYYTRESEAKQLQFILNGRAFLVSEVGYYTARHGLHCALTGEEQARRLQHELGFWQSYGAEAVCLYQERDGPSRAIVDHYGLRDFEGNWKSGVTFGG
jgi:hypothetical protein